MKINFDTIASFETRSTENDRAIPEVSVAVSLYNYGNYIEECLESIAAQDFESLELIVVDDSSQDDNSVEIAEAWMAKHLGRFRRCQLLRHERNQGLATTRNTAFANALAPFVFVVDADNLIYPTAIRKLHRAIKGTDAAAAYSQLVHFGGDTMIGYSDIWSKALLAVGPYIDAMALVRTASWKAVGGYSDIVGGWEDYDFWCKLIDGGLDAMFVPEFLCRYRVHGKSMLRTQTKDRYLRIYNQLMLRHPWLEL